MKKILVTGADGFIGSHLVEFLVKKGFNVKAFCIYNSMGSKGWLDKLDINTKNNFEYVLGDIRDKASVNDAVKTCDEIYHLASLIGIPYSYKAPSSYIDTNIHGTLNIVQSANSFDIQKVVHTSTSETYGSAQFVPITEAHPIIGQSPYAASKIGADQIAMSFYRSFNTPIAIIRPFNTYGPRQSCRAVIPTIISQIQSGYKYIKLGALTPTRDFNYVEDICNAFFSISESKKTIGKVINAASNFEISIGETASLIAELMNNDIEIVSDKERLRPIDSEVERLFGDNTLLKKLTNWEPKFGGLDGFKEGLKLTIDWFKSEKNLEKYDPKRYSI